MISLASRGTSSVIGKQQIALALVLLAGLSFLYAQVDHRIAPQANTGILRALAASDASGRPAYEMFLKVDTIDGDSTDTKHRSEISVDSFAWGETRGASAQKPSMDGFRLTMPMSSASAKLFLYGAGGTRLPRIVLSARTAGGQQDFLKWVFTDARVISYQTVGNTRGDGIQDQITLGFAKLELEYHPVLPNGSLGAAVQAGWDQRTNSAM